MGKFEVFTPEMEYPEGMTDEQAFAVYKAHEMRRFAHELEYQLENSDIYGWAEDAIEKIEAGEVTVLEILEHGGVACVLRAFLLLVIPITV